MAAALRSTAGSAPRGAGGLRLLAGAGHHDLLAVGQHAREVDRRQVRLRAGPAGGIDRVGDPCAGRQVDQSGLEHLADHVHHDLRGCGRRHPHRGPGCRGDDDRRRLLDGPQHDDGAQHEEGSGGDGGDPATGGPATTLDAVDERLDLQRMPVRGGVRGHGRCQRAGLEAAERAVRHLGGGLIRAGRARRVG